MNCFDNFIYSSLAEHAQVVYLRLHYVWYSYGGHNQLSCMDSIPIVASFVFFLFMIFGYNCCLIITI